MVAVTALGASDADVWDAATLNVSIDPRLTGTAYPTLATTAFPSSPPS